VSSGVVIRNWVPRLYNALGSIMPPCASEECRQQSRILDRVRSSGTGIRVDARWYCSPECFERAMRDEFQLLLSEERSRQGSRMHRVPLGLLLMSHGAIDHAQLTAALEAQRQAGKGRIGEWLGRIAGVNEDQITKALSDQLCCPVLRSSSVSPQLAETVPVRLLEHYRMVPVHYSNSPRNMYIAFCDQVDHSVLYGVERMLQCRTQPCLISDSTMERTLTRLRSTTRPDEVVFANNQSPSEMAKITRNYAAQLHADAAKVVACGEHVWVRLLRPRHIFNLLFQRGAGKLSGTGVRTSLWS